MTITGKFQDYSKDQLISELNELQSKYNELNSTFQNDSSEKKLIEENLILRTLFLSTLYKYAIDLGDLEGEKLYQFIVDQFRELFKVRAVWISTYHPASAELLIEASTVTNEDNSILKKLIGNSVNKFRTPVTESSYALMMNNVLEPFSSLHELTFGYIPQIIGSTIEKTLKTGWFLGISLIDKGNLYGTMVVAGNKGQELPEKDLINLFAQLTSNTIRRKQTEEKLLQSEDKFKKAFITSPDSININRLEDGMYISINNGFEKVTGYSEAEVIGKTSFELNIWANPADREKLVKGLKEKGVVENLEATFVKKSGSFVHGIMSAAVIDLDGTPHILSVTRDISDRKYAEIALRESEARYRELIELAVDGILLGSSDGTIIGANSCMLSLSGRTLNEILGMHISDLFDSSTLNTSPLRFDLLMQNETVSNERLLLRSDKSTVPVEMRTKMMPDGSYQSIYRDISFRKKSEQELQESEEWFRKLFEQSSDGIVYMSLDGKLKAVNNSFAQLHGYSKDEIQKMSIADLDCPETKTHFSERMDRILKGENLKFEVEHFHKDGHRIPIEVSTGVITMGDEIFVMASHRDISERRKAEMAIRESKEKVQSIFRVAPVGIGLTVNRIIMELNDYLCTLLGYEREELINKSSEILYPSFEEYERVGREKYDQIAIKGTGTIETIFKCKNNRLLNIILSSTPLDIGDLSRGVTFTVLDITERKESESAVKESEKRYRELFLNNPVPTYIFDTATLEFVEVNDAFVKTYGYSRAEFSKMTLKDIRLPSDHVLLVKSLRDIGDNDFHSAMVQHIRKDGTIFPVEIVSHSLPVKNGRKMRLGLVVDISERIKAAEQMKIAKEKAEASDKLKTSFLNNISHEVRTPLNGILGFAELISNENLSGSERDEAISMVHESSDRLLKTITNYMDISMLTSGNMSYNERQVDPAQILNNIHKSFEPKCTARHLDFLIEFPEKENLHSINSDPEIVEKILSHFMDNAIKFTSKGYIILGYSVHQKNLEFFVRDTGQGISNDSIESIFNRFVKEDMSSGKVSEGSGLGLAIAKGLAETAGGKVRVISEPGKGSTFYLKMSLNDSQVGRSSGNESKAWHHSAGKNTILIAEDDEINFFYLNALLSRASDSKVIHAVNGREAVEMFRSNSDIKLILMDIKMPEVNGLEATRQIKEINPDIPIIAITAYAMAGDEERVIAAGCNGYLSKPIKREILLAKIREFVII